MLRRKNSILITALLLFTMVFIGACKQPLEEPVTQASSDMVTFKLIPSEGLRSVYKVKYNGTIEIKSSASPEQDAIAHVSKDSMEVNASLETKVVSRKADGTWALSFALTTGKVKTEGKEGKVNEGFYLDEPLTIMMDSNGRLLNVAENYMAGRSYGHLLMYGNAMLMLPRELLPTKPIRVGDSWQFDISTVLPDEDRPNEAFLRVIGTGNLKSVDKARASLDLDFTCELRFASMPDTWAAKTTASVIYDLDKAQILKNKISVTKNVVGFAQSETQRGMTFTETLELELVK